jgi:hypothetical protein
MKLEPWQQNVMDTLYKYRGHGPVQITGRQLGKSHMSSSAFQRLWNDLHSSPVSDLILSEGTVYGARYYCVQPEGGNWLNMESWCVEMFGDRGESIWGEEKAPEPAQRWYANNRKFWFRSDEDRMMFVLKWR